MAQMTGHFSVGQLERNLLELRFDKFNLGGGNPQDWKACGKKYIV